MKPLLRALAAGSVVCLGVVLTTPHALATANYTGDVTPSESAVGLLNRNGDFETVFGAVIPLINGIDGIPDQGNNPNFALVDDNDPDGNPGLGIAAWDDPAVWRNYESPQNILVGETGFGLLEINAGTELRYQHLVLGGASIDLGGSLSFNEGTTGHEVYPFLADLTGAGNQLPSTGQGIVSVTGFGSVYNNDPDLIPGDVREALEAAGFDVDANGIPDGASLIDQATGMSYTRLSPLGGAGQEGGGYDVHVGLTGSGDLSVSAGGRVEIQDGLYVGMGSDAVGQVTVTGIASFITASGREEFDGMTGESQANQRLPSIIGGGGDGQLNITEGGTVNMLNGVAVGFVPEVAVADDNGSGAITVEGPGSSLNVFASNAMTSGGMMADPSTGLALVIGGIEPTAGMVANQPQGIGVVRIADNGRLNIRRAPQSYSTPQGTRANVQIGENGTLEVAGGRVELTDDLLVIGDITMATGLIQGVNADSVDPANPNPTGAPNRLFNRGDIDGYGTIRFETFENGVGATINGGVPEGTAPPLGGPLRIIISSDSTDVNRNTVPFSNRGVIQGDIDLEVVGNLENGDSGQTVNSSIASTLLDVETGGVIEARGRIESGLFFNRRYARVSVEAGRSLSILQADPDLMNPNNARTDVTLLADGLMLSDTERDGAVDADGGTYYQANLGAITVTGGSLEVGRQTEFTSLPLEERPFEEMFRNARFYDDAERDTIGEVVGTITVRDGDVTFRTGLYNSGVLSFAAGANLVRGDVINANPVEYGTPSDSLVREGIIDISGIDTTVTFEDNVYNAGTIFVGGGSQMNVLGDLDTREGDLRIAADLSDVFDGTAPIVVNGDLDIGGLGGGLSVIGSNANPANLVDGFSVTLLSATGDLLLNGPFAFANLPSLPNTGARWQIVTDLFADEVRLEIVGAGTPFIGDANNDGIVNAADYTVWADSFLSGIYDPNADFDNNGVVDEADYALWVFNVGTMGGVPAVALAVPEPATATLALLALGALGGRRRR